MDPIDSLITRLIRGFIETGVFVMTESRGLVIALSYSSFAGVAVQFLFELVFNAGRRIMNALRERSPDDGIVNVIFREIVAMGSESLDFIIESIMAIIAFFRKLFNRGADFTERLGQRSLDFTSVRSKEQ